MLLLEAACGCKGQPGDLEISGGDQRLVTSDMLLCFSSLSSVPINPRKLSQMRDLPGAQVFETKADEAARRLWQASVLPVFVLVF